MDDDDPFLGKTRSAAAETLEAASARLKPGQRVTGNLYRVVEVMRAPNGRVTRVGQIWHSDLAQVRRFGRALAGNTAGERVQVADGTGKVIEEIPLPPPGTPPAGWGQWRARHVADPAPVPPRLPRAPSPAPSMPASAASPQALTSEKSRAEARELSVAALDIEAEFVFPGATRRSSTMA